jgi:CBS domain containing-hemolysin-like protein
MWVLHLALIVGLVGVNAFFVGAEFALLSMRRSRLQQLVKAGDSRALLVQKLLTYPSLLFSGLQLGITVASLLLGWLGEQWLAGYLRLLLAGHLESWLGPVSHGIATGTAFVLITGMLMVLGELAPKTVGYERAEMVALLAAYPLTAFMHLAHYPVAFMDWLANRVALLVGVVPSTGLGEAHTAEEVKLIVAGIRKRGMLGEEQEEMIHSVFDLHRIRVREIMVPRPKITCLPMTQDLQFLLDRIVEDRYSRVPVYEGSPDHIIGILNTKDLLRVTFDRLRQRVPLDAPLDLRSLLYQPMIVPETMSLNRMLEEARARHTQMALVVDEFGTFVGLLTLEDVLEQIVGEIQDEYDREEKAIHKVGENVLVVDSSLSLRELAEDYDIVLPRGAGYETLAGFVLERLGIIPRGGESFLFEGRRYTVLEMDGRRVAKVRVEKLPGTITTAPTPPPA